MATVSYYKCLTCEGHPEFEKEPMMVHLKETHGTNPAETKGRREMLMHINAGKTHHSTYKWTLDNGVSFTQYTESKVKR